MANTFYQTFLDLSNLLVSMRRADNPAKECFEIQQLLIPRIKHTERKIRLWKSEKAKGAGW